MPAAKLHPATSAAPALGERDQRDKRGGMDHAVERAGAQQLGGFRIIGEMRRQRPGNDGNKPTKPRDGKP
jgi:hypothetical protein